jgi:hypothetical protein
MIVAGLRNGMLIHTRQMDGQTMKGGLQKSSFGSDSQGHPSGFGFSRQGILYGKFITSAFSGSQKATPAEANRYKLNASWAITQSLGKRPQPDGHFRNIRHPLKMTLWQKWDGESDLKMVVLVKTEDGTIVTAQQPKGLPKYWVIYEPGTPILFQPELKSTVVEYIDLNDL